MFEQINGLPAHILLIHAVVVLIPLAAVMTAVGAVWPAARRRLGAFTPAVALVGLVLVPITTHAGEWLEHRLPESQAIEKHADLGDTLLPWAAGLFLVAAGIWFASRRYDLAWRPGPAATDATPADPAPGGGGTATAVRPAPTRQAVPTWVTAVVAVVAIAVSAGATIQLYRIGDSGAKAAWNYVKDLPERQGGDGD